MASRYRPAILFLLISLLNGWQPRRCFAAAPPNAPPAALEIQVEQGAGAAHQPGSRSAVPLTLRVVDEAGRPVPGATVSLLMPDDGPAGVFPSGLSTEILVTGADGRVSVRGIRWGPEPGLVGIRVTAVKGPARAGTVVNQQIEPRDASATDPATGRRSPSVSKPRGRWVILAVVAAGAAAGGLALGLAGGGTPPAGAPPAAGAIETPGIQVGLPTIVVGKP
jgi:hypothetical protein